jgi:hypothetical protein
MLIDRASMSIATGELALRSVLPARRPLYRYHEKSLSRAAAAH